MGLEHETGEPRQYSHRDLSALLLLASLLCGALVISVSTGSKLFSVFGLTASVSALVYPITFLATDIVSEVWGKQMAQHVVWSGLVVLLLAMFYFEAVVAVPGAAVWDGQAEFEAVFGRTPRYIVGGIVGYVVSQLHDIHAFHFWRVRTGGRHLWIRNNLSTIVSQFVDTLFFVVIAFAGTTELGPLIVGQFILKAALAVLDTPFVYLGVRLVRGRAA